MLAQRGYYDLPSQRYCNPLTLRGQPLLAYVCELGVESEISMASDLKDGAWQFM